MVSFRLILEELLGPGWRVFQRFWLAFVLIQIGAVSLVAAYYQIPAFSEFCVRIADLKEAWGLLFPIVFNPIAAGCVPEFFRQITGRGDRWTPAYIKEFLYLMAVFALMGVIVDQFYYGQGRFFGVGNDVATIAKKVLVDQLIFSPLFAQPLVVSLMFLYQVRFNLVRLGQAWQTGFYRKAVLPLILPGWFFWFPMTACIYAMPSHLQMPLFLCALSAWTLIFVGLAGERTRQKAAEPVLT